MADHSDSAQQLPPHLSSTTTSLPLDVATSRQNRINREILSFFQRPTAPNSPNPPSAKGIGIYTHIELTTPEPQNLFPHQRFVPQPEPRTQFLPLGGPGKRERKGGLRGEIPDDVRILFEQVKGVLATEEKAVNEGMNVDPREKYKVLGLPGIMVPPPPPPPPPPSSHPPRSPPREIDTDIGGTDDTNRETEQRRKEVSESEQPSGGEVKRSGDTRTSSSRGDTIMGGTRADVATKAASGTVKTAVHVEAPSPAPTGLTTYDASRDPRLQRG